MRLSVAELPRALELPATPGLSMEQLMDEVGYGLSTSVAFPGAVGAVEAAYSFK